MSKSGMVRKLRESGLAAVVFGLLVFVGPAAGPALAGVTGLASVGHDGSDVNGDSVYPTVSADGRFAAYATRATNIIPTDANGSVLDIVVRDLQAGVSEVVSVNTEGVQADADSENPSLSADGRFVAFQSKATNLGATDATPLQPDVFLHDRSSGTTTLVCVNANGEPANGQSYYASVSADGRYVAFLSQATNLDVGRTDSNGAVVDVFVRDLQLGTTTLVSVNSFGVQGTADAKQVAISGDGRSVALVTAAALVGGTRDTNGTDDVYLRDLVASTTVLVSRRYDGDKKAGGNCANPSLTFAGGLVAFDSPALNLVEGAPPQTRRRVYVYEPSTDTMRLASLGLGGENPDQVVSFATISPEGRYVSFSSAASNLVAGDLNGVSDVFVHDLSTGATVRQSVSSEGTEGNGASATVFVSLSTDASVLAFRSAATNLVPGTPAGSRYRIYYRQLQADPNPPTIACPESIAAECQGTGGAVVEFTVTAEDEVDPAPVVVCDPPSGSEFPIGATEVQCTATDASGNSASCSFTVTVSDTTGPTIVCPEKVTAGAESSESPIQVHFPAPTVTDLCDATPSLEVVPPSGSLFPIGVSQVVCSATDAAGNRSTCTFEVEVIISSDSTPPEVVCPSSPVAAACTGPEGAVVTFEVSATDDRDPSPTVTAVPSSGSAFPVGTTTVTVTARDATGNESTCGFDVTVSDGTAPEIQCPEAIETDCADGSGAPVTFEVSATDACDAAPTVTSEPASGSVFPFGTTAVTVTARDSAGNESTCTFDVTVADRTGPAIQCPEAIEADCADGAGAPVTFEVSATDACDAAPTVTSEPASGSVFPFGTTAVTVTARDSAGNESTCTFDVTVRDLTGPAIQCPEAVSAACTSAEGAIVEFEVAVTDACDPEPIVAVEPASGTLFPPGTTTVTVTATDAGGNETTCAFEVTVAAGEAVFIRGDADGSGMVNLTDPIVTLDFLFRTGDAPPCFDAADAEDDGRLNITDPIYTLRWLFLDGEDIPPPGGLVPGPDPTEDDFTCEAPSC